MSAVPPAVEQGDRALAAERVMEQKTFFDHFRIVTRRDGSPREVRSAGAAIHYKAIDTRTSEPVTLQLIPIGTLDEAKREQFEEQANAVQKLDHINIAKVHEVLTDRDHIGLVSEYVEGESTEAWLAQNGAMPADAVLRIGLQVVRALAAAAFHRLAHRAIQPSNIVIVPGQSADGGWPLVKLVNFGLSGSEIHSDGDETREIAAANAPQFSSPEQLLNKPIDFRSEIYSLGATMCFLLTGAVPLAASGMKMRLRARRLPELKRAPGALRTLLLHMLQEDPEARPHDPVAFEAEMRDCLTKIERRQNIGRKLGIPLAAVIPRKPVSSALVTPLRQVVRGAMVFAGLLVGGAILAALFLPEDKVPFLHRHSADDRVGVVVGVPEATAPQLAKGTGAPVSVPIPAPAVSATAKPAAAVVAQQPVNPPVQVAVSTPNPLAATTATPEPAVVAQAASTPVQIAAVTEAEPQPPALGPRESIPSDERAEPAQNSQSSDSENSDSVLSSHADKSAVAAGEASLSDSSSDAVASTPVKKKAPNVASSERSTPTRSHVSPPRTNHSGKLRIQSPSGHPVQAQVVRALPDGRVILRLPSGRTVLAVPEGSRFAPRPHRRVIQQEEMAGPAPYQPFDPNGD